jgi:hypothetical protein
MFSVAQTVELTVVGLLIDDDDERMWVAVFMACFRNCSVSHLDMWRKTEIFSQKGLFPIQDSNWTLIKYKAEVLPPKTS